MPDQMSALVDGLRKAYANTSPADALQGIRDAINKRPPGVEQEVVPGWPKVATPPQFRPFPEVIGDKKLYDAVQNTFRIAPEIQGQFKRIGYPPSVAALHEMTRSHIPVEDYAGTTLMGMTDASGGNDRQVYINPNYPGELDSTVLHELSHVAGMGELGAREMEAAYERTLPQKPQPASGDALQGLIEALKKGGVKPSEIRIKQ